MRANVTAAETRNFPVRLLPAPRAANSASLASSINRRNPNASTGNIGIRMSPVTRSLRWAAFFTSIRYLTTHNQGELDLYKEMAPTALAGHPITFRIAHGHKEVVEGPDFEDMMMLEFPTFREARAWYDSPAYQAASEHRFKGADYRAIMVEGVPPK